MSGYSFEKEKLFLFNHFWMHTADNIFINYLDEEGDFVIEDFNPSQVLNLGLPENIKGLKLKEVLESSDAQDVEEKYHRCLKQNEPLVQTEQVSINGQTRYYETLTLPILDGPDGRPRVMGIAREITSLIESNNNLQHLNSHLNELVESRTIALQQANEKLNALAFTDALTQLPNRHHFLEASKKTFSLSLRKSAPVSLLIMDLDFFKNINDTFGHLFGDKVLKSFAKMLRNQCREYDEICRYGGEEFLILLPMTSSDEALETADRILAQTRRISKSLNEVLDLTVSIGVSTTRVESVTINGLIEAADEALYLAKQGGRNQVRFNAFRGE